MSLYGYMTRKPANMMNHVRMIGVSVFQKVREE